MKFILLALLVIALPVSAFASEKITIDLEGKSYTVELEDNVTVNDIVKNLPLSLKLTRFGGHEFYSELAFRPEFASERTSHILAGHLYYWDGWNAFVINYIDWDISPYNVVHLGQVLDESESQELCRVLRACEDSINAKVSK